MRFLDRRNARLRQHYARVRAFLMYEIKHAVALLRKQRLAQHDDVIAAVLDQVHGMAQREGWSHVVTDILQ